MYSFLYVYVKNNNKGLYSGLIKKVEASFAKGILVLLAALVFGVFPNPGIAQAQSEINTSFPDRIPALFSGEGVMDQQGKDPLAISFWGDVASGRYRITIQDGAPERANHSTF